MRFGIDKFGMDRFEREGNCSEVAQPSIRCRITSAEAGRAWGAPYKCFLESLRYGQPNQIIDTQRGLKTANFVCSGLFVISGWVRVFGGNAEQLLGSDAEVILVNYYGGNHFGRIVACSNLAPRDDLPEGAAYFSLSVLAAHLLLRNAFVIQLRNADGVHGLYTISMDCMPLDGSSVDEQPPRYISMITAGRSGSTLLCKALGAFPDLISLSTEQSELTMLRSSLKTVLDGFSLQFTSTHRGSHGDLDPFFRLPYVSSRNPYFDLYTINNLRLLFDGLYSAALAYYGQIGQAAERGSIIVEKNWCDPIVPLLAKQLGIVHLVLLRHPHAMANSIRAYQLKTSFDVGFDAHDSRQLVESVSRFCAGLDWLAMALPNAVILRYEDLVFDVSGEVGRMLAALGIPQPRILAGQERLAMMDISPKLGHQTGVELLTAGEKKMLTQACSGLIKKYYGDDSPMPSDSV